MWKIVCSVAWHEMPSIAWPAVAVGVPAERAFRRMAWGPWSLLTAALVCLLS
jgi:hypothetical protein